MAARWHRMFQRTLRNLRDLRRYPPQVVVQRVDQLNVAQQQLNVAGGVLPPDSADRPGDHA
jgi:hypothetical protein